MKKQIMVAVLASAAWAFVGGTAMGQVAGSSTIGVTVEEQKALALGWSAEKHIPHSIGFSGDVPILSQSA
jgi:hypothetical protein